MINNQPPLPNLLEIIELWNCHDMLPNIRSHSRVVCAVALLLTDWLAEAGASLNRRLVAAGALLHDIAKTACLGTNRRHDLEGETILRAAGYPELGQLVALHVFLPDEQPLDEVMVVNYADKRVNDDSIVNLNQRYAYIADRYGKSDPKIMARIERGRHRTNEVERLLFKTMGHQHSPDEVARRWCEKL